MGYVRVHPRQPARLHRSRWQGRAGCEIRYRRARAGHAGVAYLNRSDGTGEYGDFQPKDTGSAEGVGLYRTIDISVTYGADGRPTDGSLVALANKLADAEHVPHESVSIAYFKTSPQETAALRAYIENAVAAQQQGK